MLNNSSNNKQKSFLNKNSEEHKFCLIDAQSFLKQIRPIRFQFYINFIDIKSTKLIKISDKLLLVSYNILWISDIVSRILCYKFSKLNIFLLTITSKLLSFTAWWILWKQKSQIWSLLQQINTFRNLFKTKISLFAGYCLRLSYALLLASIFVQCLYKALRTLYRSKRSRHDKCRFLGIQPTSKDEKVIPDFFSKLISLHLDWNIHYAIAVLYCFCCKELGRTIRALCSNRGYFNSRKIWKQYYLIRDCMKEIEEIFSIPIFILFARSFVEFFRVLSFLLNRITRNLDVAYSVVNGLHSCVVLAVFISVVLSANYLLNSYKILCVKMMRIPREAYCTENQFETYRNCRLVLNQKDSVTLTAWGMLHLKKNLLVTAVATLVTYGVILHQFHGR